MRTILSLLIVTVVIAAPASANDSTAELAAGGLVFVRNDAVEMRAEDLFISTDEVSVRYRFFNRTANDVAVLVAFPMPDIQREESDTAIPSDDPVNFLAFSTRVDGRPINAEVEQRVLAAGIDRTAMLRDAGIPLSPHLPTTEQSLSRMPEERRTEFVRLGLATVEEYDSGKGMERHLMPGWILKTVFHWQQTFPAQRELVIEHRYKPAVGSSVMTSLGMPGSVKETWHADYRRKYCIDDDVVRRLDRARRAVRADNPPYSEQRIEYILKTGANWSGPIGDFRLVVDKGDASSLMSFCGENIRKVGLTRFEMRKKNYTPDRDLSILLLRRINPG